MPVFWDEFWTFGLIIKFFINLIIFIHSPLIYSSALSFGVIVSFLLLGFLTYLGLMGSYGGEWISSGFNAGSF